MKKQAELWSILDIANETGVTKTTVSRKIKELGISYIKYESNKQYYRYADVKKIIDVLNPKEENYNSSMTEKTEEKEKTAEVEGMEQTTTEECDKTQSVTKSQNVVETNRNNSQQNAINCELYERIIKGLEERVEAQEKQIKEQNDIISNLLDKNDQLTAKNLFLISQQNQVVIEDEEEQQEVKKSFFQRLFNK